ncbi:MAG: hypothetical protein K2Q22_05745, partial [Cytophagales bacterium]|nr:hypothetical protein [Cytophagales bacterium]
PLLRTTFENDVFKNGSGLGFFVKADVDKKLSTLPFGAEFYYIGKNLVSLDGGIVNSNTNVRVGGYQVPDPAKPNEYNVYDNLLLEGLAQEVGILANNRMGLNLKAKKKIGKFSIQVSNGFSQEIENSSNYINIQHRVNAFSSSRFRPWFQAAGPYSRIRSNFRRTYETFTINDVYNNVSTDYRKGFNSLDVFLKFRTKLFGKELMLFNFSNFSSTQQGLAPIPLFNDKAFVRSFYNAFDVAYKLSPKYSVVAQYGVEKVLGNNRIDMVQNDGTTVTTDKNDPKGAKTVNQLGQSLGFGVDYDFAPTAGLHLRHKFMWHEDQNFVLDKYVGQETYLELKIFFQ